MFRILTISAPLLLIGCGASAEEMRQLQENIGTAKANLRARVREESERLASSKEPAESIGYAVLSSCGREIDAVMDAGDAEFFAQRRGRLATSYWYSERDNTKKDIEASVYREAVAIVVRARANAR